MNIPVSDLLLEGEAEEVLPVPLSSRQMAYVRRRAEAHGISERQFVRFILNKLQEADSAFSGDPSESSSSRASSPSEPSPSDSSSERESPRFPSDDSGSTTLDHLRQHRSSSSDTQDDPEASGKETDDNPLNRSMFDYLRDESP
ncbi:MAG: hypothetical protein PPP56_10375 [Longimonas sp.]|uniref:hypothetical protein n=1 Tax=Longimonas sp. TaxID=2039626 RepID=UPI0033607ABD